MFRFPSTAFHELDSYLRLRRMRLRDLTSHQMTNNTLYQSSKIPESISGPHLYISPLYSSHLKSMVNSTPALLSVARLLHAGIMLCEQRATPGTSLAKATFKRPRLLCILSASDNLERLNKCRMGYILFVLLSAEDEVDAVWYKMDASAA